MPIRVIGSFAVAHPGSRADETHVGERSARPDVVLKDGKAFGTLGAASLAASANRTPRRAALFYATDDDQAAATVERLISAAGFDPVKAGGLQAAGRIETPGGDLQESGLGRLVDAERVRS